MGPCPGPHDDHRRLLSHSDPIQPGCINRPRPVSKVLKLGARRLHRTPQPQFPSLSARLGVSRFCQEIESMEEPDAK